MSELEIFCGRQIVEREVIKDVYKTLPQGTYGILRIFKLCRKMFELRRYTL